MELSSDAFAAKEKLESITISYTTGSTVDIVVTDKHGDVILTVDDYESGDLITINKSIFDNDKFPSQLFFTASDTGTSEEIHTSGSQLLFPGQLSGAYTIVDLLTTDGGHSLGNPNKNKHKVLTGEGPPPPSLGKIGDLYFDNFDKLVSYVKNAVKIIFDGNLSFSNLSLSIRNVDTEPKIRSTESISLPFLSLTTIVIGKSSS